MQVVNHPQCETKTRLISDPVVLESPAFLRPGGPGQVPPVCYRYLQGAPAGLHGPGGNERHPEVPDPPRRPLH